MALASAAHAQTVAEGVVVYEPDFFASFSPRTALDMVERVPGFTIDEGEDRRGFAGAQANVLIDGEPPTSKAQEIDDILARIPAQDVVRIELIRGASSSTGQSARVNVVRGGGGGEGVWSATLAHTEDGRIAPAGEAAFSGRAGSVEYALSAALQIDRFPIRGLRFDYDDTGALDERRDESLPSDEGEARLGGEASFPLWGGTGSINAQLSRWEFDELLASRMTDPLGAPAGSLIGDLTEFENLGEIGASWRREIGAWRNDISTVITRRLYEAEEGTVDRDGAGVLDEAAQQAQRVESGETILRWSGRRALSNNWQLQLGAEAALNTLEQRLSLIIDEGSGPAPVLLPSANVRVEEERGEVSFSLSGPLAPRWTLEAGAAAEASRLTQTGDVDLETELAYLKPTIQLTRAFGARNQLRLRVYRDVGQLDFEDFVSASDIQSSLVDAGNPDLRPETSWRVEAAGDWRFGEDGAFGLTLYHWAIEDAVDVVPVGTPGNLFDAPGNIGDATLWGARMQLALPLPANAELRLEAVAQKTEATDPLTGETRAISESDETGLSVELRQDIGSFAWGVEYERETEAPAYRLDRIESEQDAENLMLWIETTAFADVKLRAWASNLTDSPETRDRRIFDPDRLGAFDGSDTRARRDGVTLGVSVSGRF